MKKILIILTGGTICSAPDKDGVLSVESGAGLKLIENYGYESDIRFVLSENLFILSENMTAERWNLILDTYRRETKKDSFDGVIIAHGTDTLGFSAALFSMILSGTDIPVFFVSSNKRLGIPGANGYDNFTAAAECIKCGISPNVYVTYKNISDGKMYLHLASRIFQCGNYSEDFYGADAIRITDYNEVLRLVKDRFPPEKRRALIDVYGDWNLTAGVLFIKPYVGIDYSAFDYSRYSAVLHGTYHSGTVCTSNASDEDEFSVFHMLNRCKETAADVYFSPSKKHGEIYESLKFVREYVSGGYRAHFLYGFTDEVSYAKLLLAYSVFKDEKDRLAFIETECNFEKLSVGEDLYD